MRLYVHRSGDAFLEALKTGNGCHYAVFGRSATSPHVLRTAETLAVERGHIDAASAPGLRAEGERLLRAFFDAAARGDPRGRFAYSSRVLLAIPDYPDISLIFLLRALALTAPQSTVHAFAEDPWKAGLVAFECGEGKRPRFRPGAFRGLARAARSTGRALFRRRLRSRCDVLIVTLGENLANGGADAYFGDLPEALLRRCRTLTVYAAPGARLMLPASESMAPLEAFIGPLDPLRAWAAAHKATPDGENVSAPDTVLTAYLRAREIDSGEVAMLDVMARAFARMLDRLEPRTVVYPFENRTWEKSLLAAARRRGTVRCIGYQHSSITPRHLALHGGAETGGRGALPDAIITCGEITAALLASGMPEAKPRLSVGPALRARRLTVPEPDRPGVLAPISSSRAEAWEILRVMHGLARESTVPIVVRTHPTIPIDDLYAQLDWPSHVTLSRGRSLAEDFAGAAFIAYSSSTVALEGMLYGRLPIYIDIGDVPSGDPIVGEHPFVFRASTGRELAQTIARVSVLGMDELAALRAAARAYANAYLVEPSAENVERMAERIATC